MPAHRSDIATNEWPAEPRRGTTPSIILHGLLRDGRRVKSRFSSAHTDSSCDFFGQRQQRGKQGRSKYSPGVVQGFIFFCNRKGSSSQVSNDPLGKRDRPALALHRKTHSRQRRCHVWNKRHEER